MKTTPITALVRKITQAVGRLHDQVLQGLQSWAQPRGAARRLVPIRISDERPDHRARRPR
jgi:hypothetical protein